ncbi:MAG TPA: DUF465 domain-containing protein [Pseudolabrys sp.]|nr:DUF465 domain-containing protein [Pseudolabrys sp.]
MTIPANIADLVRLEDEIDEALLNLLNKPTDAKTIADLKRRKDHLRDEIECLLHEVEGAGRGPH